MMRNRIVLGAALAVGMGWLPSPLAASGHRVTGKEPVVGGRCEGCEAVFQGLPAELASRERIAPAGEAGEPLRITGRVRHADGTAAAGIVVYAYHTDAKGIYPRVEKPQGRAADRHGRLRGWVVTDADGRYTFETIRPGGYPDAGAPQHVHMHVIEPGRCTYYIDDVVFTDDPRLAAALAEGFDRGRGGSGVVTPRRDASGVWIAERDIALGKRIPDYPTAVRGTGTSRDSTGSR